MGPLETPYVAPIPAATVDPALPSLSSLQRLVRLFRSSPRFAYLHAEQWIVRRMARSGLVLARVALGIIFLWFGLLKFYPVVQPIDILAEKVLTVITFHLFRPESCLHVLAFFECVIGLGMLTGKFLRVTILLLFLQMPGTFLPFLLLPHETWVHFPYLPSFEGQYIIKNFVLISAGIFVGASVRGGRFIANPRIARKAERVEIALELQVLAKTEAAVRSGEPQS